MIVINKENKEIIKDLILHDAELREIICNYYEHKVVIPLVINKKKVQLIFEDVLHIDIGFLEPWGAGIYINEFIINNGSQFKKQFNLPIGQDENNILFTVLLNSGDKINIMSSKMIYKDEKTL